MLSVCKDEEQKTSEVTIMEDDKIIELFFARKEEAITQTEAMYGKRLFRLADRIVRNRLDAQECVNDTYLKAWETIPPQKPRFYFAYLARLCRNASLDRLDRNDAAKRNAEVVSLTEEMELCIPDRMQEHDPAEISRTLDAFLRTLSAENRLVFVRRYWYADSIAEIAARYSISESAVLMRLNRTREKLRAYLKKEGIKV